MRIRASIRERLARRVPNVPDDIRQGTLRRSVLYGRCFGILSVVVQAPRMLRIRSRGP